MRIHNVPVEVDETVSAESKKMPKIRTSLLDSLDSLIGDHLVNLLQHILCCVDNGLASSRCGAEEAGLAGDGCAEHCDCDCDCGDVVW